LERRRLENRSRPRKREEARGIRQSAELHTWMFTLGAMSMAVKQYNVDVERSIRPSHSLLWIHGHIGVDERVNQVFDSGLEDMDVLARLNADHALSHP